MVAVVVAVVVVVAVIVDVVVVVVGGDDVWLVYYRSTRYRTVRGHRVDSVLTPILA